MADQNFLEQLANVEADERAELVACGVMLEGTTKADGQREYQILAETQEDAVVSQLQRRMIALEADRARYRDAMMAEIELITNRYTRIVTPITAQLGRTEKIILDIAARADFGMKGSKAIKSRKTPYGTYGRKFTPATILITGPSELVAWAKDAAPDIVETPDPKPQDPRVPFNRILSYIQGRRLLKPSEPVAIPGVLEVPERDEPYVKLAKGDDNG